MYITTLLLVAVICSLGSSDEGTLSRVRRQSDSTTEVVGLALSKRATDGDYQTLKKGARQVSRRYRRGVFDIDLSNPFEAATKPLQQAWTTAQNQTQAASQHLMNSVKQPIDQLSQQVTNLPVVKDVVTAIQHVFDKINHDFKLAKKLVRFVEKEDNPVLKKMVVVNENGVGCSDVCQPDGNGYGTIGICTPKYCTCDFKTNDFSLLRCGGGHVFDTLEKKCNPPGLTVLCSDEEVIDGGAGH
ncbi:unnamed protein product [Allacma fusca]|uniref:Uncharacterized protein n=1 Tax=Allacma fusca TaxID=39272 RepID=A0A8J2LL77_9HEXA|nr:unnamed protein product [Allacma fusca]